MTINPIPDGYHTLTPYLSVNGVAEVIEFLQKAFDATVIAKLETANGVVQHAEIQIGDSKIMIGEVPKGYPATPAMLYMYVPDVDAAYKKAIEAGGKSIMEPKDQFYGDRSGAIEDTGGNKWWLASRVEEVSMEELQKRMDSLST